MNTRITGSITTDVSFIDFSEQLDIRSPNGLPCECGGCEDCGYTGQTYAVAIIDVDKDGTLDLYVNHHYTTPSELLKSFATDASAHTELDFRNSKGLPYDSHGAVFFDIDQDGDLDLLESRGGNSDRYIDPQNDRHWNGVYENTGGSLSLNSRGDYYGIDYGPSRGTMITPINHNGDMALFIGTDEKNDGTYPSKLMRAEADGTYADWTLFGDPNYFNGVHFVIGAHLDEGNEIDLVAMRFQSFSTIMDTGNGFEGAQEFTQSLSHPGWSHNLYDVQIADFNGDLRQEIFVSQQSKMPDRLYSLSDTGTWTDITVSSGLTVNPTHTRATTVGDFDNDGDVDIVTFNKIDYGYPADTAVFHLRLNDGTGVFTDSEFVVPGVTGDGDMIVSGDFDNNGWLDLILTTGGGRPANHPNVNDRAKGEYVWLGSEGGTNNWLNIALEGVDSERNGLGARVYVTTGDGKVQMREQDSGAHSRAQDSQRLHFGLGEQTEATEVKIVWADGFTQVVNNVSANQHITITEDRSDTSGGSGPQFDLVFSDTDTRLDPQPLGGAEVAAGDTFYVFVDGDIEVIEQVDFYFDGALVNTKVSQPFDLNGTTPGGLAVGFPTNDLSVGLHTVVAEVTFDDSGVSNTQTLTETFSVSGSITNPGVIAEFGHVRLNHFETVVTLNNTFENPVVIAVTPSHRGADNISVRFAEIEGNSFTTWLDETSDLDGAHAFETVSYLVVEAGTWQLADGTKLQAGTVSTDKMPSDGFEQVTFDKSFDSSPVVLTHLQSYNDTDFANARKHAVTNTGFWVGIEEEEAGNINGSHPTEEIGWFAIEEGRGTWSDATYLADIQARAATSSNSYLSFDSAFTEAPELFAQTRSYRGADPVNTRYKFMTKDGATVVVQEDRSLDTETNHTVEDIDLFALQGPSADLSASIWI